ncbi:uncharacterized protein LOC112088882 [Eutrema salsugineum]|uniref:uncharacterized protein LOC112088882 n=1 Tax=Eutrema salsugineum TaxID=72664 RepID=UPI000CED339D|nr:uncharacterized protein LOC112088882 [Eutrema salsugineum]
MVRIRFIHTIDAPEPKRHVKGSSTIRDAVHHRLLSRQKEYSGMWVRDPLLFATTVDDLYSMIGVVYDDRRRIWFCSLSLNVLALASNS